MSFLSDLIHGNFSNLGHDLISAPANLLEHPAQIAEIGAGIAAPFVLPEIAGALGVGGAAGGSGFLGGLFGGGEAAAGGATEALGFAPTASGTATGGLGAIEGALGGGGNTLDTLAATGNLSSSVPSALDLGSFTSAATGAGSVVPSATSGGGFFDSLVGGISKGFTSNPLGIAAAGGGLLLNFLRGNQTDPNQQALQNLAPQLAGQAQQYAASGQQLQSYLTSGTLPPGLQAQVTNAVSAAKAQIIQGYASRGQPTDPTQNSALAQELAQADTNGLALAGQMETQLAQMGQQLINTGLNETGLSTQLYETLAKMDQQQNQDLMSSIANFAAALGGGSKGINLKLA